MNLRALICFVLIVSSFELNGQIFRRFSTDLEKYPGELDVYLGNSLSEDELLSLQGFITRWQSGEIPDTNKSYLIAVSNFMLSRNARPKPHYYLLLSTMERIEASGLPRADYDNWKRAYYDLVSNPRSTLNRMHNFLEFSYRLISNNVLNTSSSATWKTDGGSYRISYKDSLEIMFETISLCCQVSRDSFYIYRTSGVYRPESKLWQGTGGRVTWERSAYDTSRIYAELSSYTLDMSMSHYQADSVSFTNLDYLDYSLYGKLEERSQVVNSPDLMNYPRFDSYRSDYRIDNLYENINYRGGLSMHGSLLIGSGTESSRARLTFYRNDTLKLTAGSERFAMDPSRITSADVSVNIPVGFDSVIHPSIGMTYFVDENQLSLYRNQRFQSQVPYYNNYHGVEMNFEQLQWNLEENRILFKMREASATGLATFESENLYDAQAYLRLQGIDPVNPLVSLRGYGEKTMDVTFKGTDYARYVHAQHYQVQQLLKRLAIAGFIIYDLDDDLITLRQKLFDWVYASVDFIDYDVINFVSETEAPLENASLDLSTYDLTINGLRSIRISNAQNVDIFPDNARVILKRNRSFQFDGVVVAGLFTLFGNNFFFDYEEFKLELQDIDSLNLRFRTDQLDAMGRTTLMNVQNMIRDMTGELLIDDPGNKSGRDNYPQYPVFNSRENSFVYYDGPEIQNGVYGKDRFYFEIYPFTFDSLDNFNALGLKLDGRFVSAGIFPEIEQTLVLQEDNSLGFNHSTGPSGLPLYGGRGNYHDFIHMTNKGLRGSGRFEYLTARGQSGDVVFHPDSMFCNAREFGITAQVTGIQYPAVTSGGNDVLWYPYREEMDIAPGSGPFAILNDSTFLEGTLTLSPAGLTGSGKMELTNSVLLSDQFTYLARAFDADTADLRLKSVNTRGYTLVTDNVNAHVDFGDRSGLFKTNEDFSLVEFPENKYVSQLDLFQWNMDDNELVMGSESTGRQQFRPLSAEELETPLEGPRYISTDPYQDSLDFISSRAVYDYRRNIIRASNVRYLKVADAFIFPARGEVSIEPDGTMARLDSAKVLANRYSKLHGIYDASLQVEGKNRYLGSGKYDYTDETGKIQVILLDRIQVDDSLQTIARGRIPLEQEFTLSPDYGFTGEVHLSADKRYLRFEGGVVLVHYCEQIDTNYLKFEAEIDPREIYIPVPARSFDHAMRPLYSGLFITRDSAHIYPSFLSGKKLASDRYIVTADGFLYFDKASEEYRIAGKDKLGDPALPGNYLSLQRYNCQEYGEGQINLGVSLGQVRTSAVGNVTHDMNSNQTTLNIMLNIDFFMSGEAMAIMGAELDSLQELEAVDLSGAFYNKGLAEILGMEKAQELQAELGLFGEYQELPDELVHTLSFSRLTLRWNQNTRSYRSVGKIGIGSINGEQIHKQVNGYMELSRRRSGDLFDVYLEPDGRTWYYFGYTRGVMHCLSGNREFNTTIGELNTRQRQMKTPRNEIPFIYIVATARKKDMFLRNIQLEEEPLE